jgi:L-amino acid N-acyltransferase YncA
VIVKTLAVDPDARCAGLGSLLVDELHRIGLEKGYTEAIHALQHETNTSLKITGRHHGEVFRRYALFSKLL